MSDRPRPKSNMLKYPMTVHVRVRIPKRSVPSQRRMRGVVTNAIASVVAVPRTPVAKFSAERRVR